MGLLSLQGTHPHPTPPVPTPYEMSGAQDPAHVVATQVKLWGWSGQDGGSGALYSRQYQELRAFLYLLGELPWGWHGVGL